MRHKREPAACSLELGGRTAYASCDQTLMELTKVLHAPGRPDLLTLSERVERDAARLFKLPGVQVRVGQYHHGEEVTSHECCFIDCRQAAARVLRGVVGPPEITQAVPELGGQF